MSAETLVQEQPIADVQYEPQVHIDTFGYDAVVLDRQQSSDAGGSAVMMLNELGDVRTEVAKFKPWQKHIFQLYCKTPAAPILEEITDGQEVADWGTWFAKEAKDEQVLKFLNWHVGKMEGLQNNPVVQDEIQEQKLKYKQSIKDGVNDLWLPKSAQAAIDKVDNVEVYLGDIFDTLLQDCAAHYTVGEDNIVVGATDSSQCLSVLSATTVLRRLTSHELNHAALGWLPFWWLDETGTEHIALSSLGGHPEVLDPSERDALGCARGIYVPPRHLVADILSKGDVVIPTSRLVGAYVNPNGKFKFSQEVDRAWPQFVPKKGRECSVLNTINKHVKSLENQYVLMGERKSIAANKAIQQTHQAFLETPEVIFS